MSLDSDSVEALLENIHPNRHNDYASINWITTLSDTNAGNYNSGLINFDTLAQKTAWIDYRYAYFVIPMVIAGTKANPFTAPVNSQANVCLKNGVAQLIYSFHLKMEDVKVQDTQNLNQYNTIMEHIQNSLDWEQSNGSLYMLSRDTLDSNDASKYIGITAPIGSLRAAVAGGVSALPPVPVKLLVQESHTYNEGFAHRLRFMDANYSTTGAGASMRGSWSFRAIIPLRLISGFFAQLQHPLYNIRMMMSLGITGLVPSAAGQTAVMADDAALDNTNVNGCSTPVLSICNQNRDYPLAAGIEGSCRLYLPEITYSVKLAEKVAEKLNSGFTKKVSFYDTKTFFNPNSGVRLNLDCLLTPGITAPQRIFTTAFEQGSMGMYTSPSPCQSTGIITGANILIDNKRHYSDDINYDFEAFGYLQREFFNSGEDNITGSLIRYQDFADKNFGNKRFYVHNISKFINASPTPLKPFAISFRGNLVYPPRCADEAAAQLLLYNAYVAAAAAAVAAGGAAPDVVLPYSYPKYDVYHHIEFEVHVTIDMSAGTVTTVNAC